MDSDNKEEKTTLARVAEAEKRYCKFLNQKKRAKGPVEYEHGLPLLPRYYLHFPKDHFLNIKQFMIMPREDFERHLHRLRSDYIDELKCMKEEYYSIRPSRRCAVITLYLQRNEELGVLP